MGPGPERQMAINLVAEYDMLYSINGKHSGPLVGVLGNGGFTLDGVTFSLR
jgi:hypothetical protein